MTATHEDGFGTSASEAFGHGATKFAGSADDYCSFALEGEKLFWEGHDLEIRNFLLREWELTDNAGSAARYDLFDFGEGGHGGIAGCGHGEGSVSGTVVDGLFGATGG